MNDAYSGTGLLDGTAYPVGATFAGGDATYGGLGATALEPRAGALDAVAAAPAPTLETRLFDGGFITGEQLEEIVREQSLSGRSAEEIVRERGYAAPGVVDRLLGRVPPPEIGSFELVPPAPAPATELPAVGVADPLPVPAEPEPAPASPAPPKLAFDLAVTLRCGAALTAAHGSLEAAQEAACTLVAAGADEWLSFGSGYLRGGEAVAVEIRPRLLS